MSKPTNSKPESANIPQAIESEAKDLAHGTHLTTREAVVVLCGRQGYANESIRAHLGATKTAGEVALDEIGELLGLSNNSVEAIRADIRRKRRELADEREKSERTLDVLGSY